MTRYVIRRLLQAIPLLVAISIIVLLPSTNSISMLGLRPRRAASLAHAASVGLA